MLKKIGTAEPIITKINVDNIVSKEDITDTSEKSKVIEKDKKNG